MSVYQPKRFREEVQRFRPEILAVAKGAWEAGKGDLDCLRLDSAAFTACASDSIDYAVMERTSASAMIQADIGWSDVGSWAALWDAGEKDASDNVVRGDVDVREANGCYIRAEHRMVAALGVHDLVIVETDDAVLVADKSRSQEVKEVVETLGSSAVTDRLLRDAMAARGVVTLSMPTALSSVALLPKHLLTLANEVALVFGADLFGTGHEGSVLRNVVLGALVVIVFSVIAFLLVRELLR